MNTYTWFYIFNLIEFEALGLVSRSYSLVLDQVGQIEVLVTKGNYVSMTYDDVLLPINLNDANPFEFETYACYLDENNNVWLGILEADT